MQVSPGLLLQEVRKKLLKLDKDTRLRTLKERQNEERQRKLEEIKAQALAAQRFKEQKEQERRRRLEELRIKDDVRRIQVEERKKAINDAERDRLEYIIKRNQEREQRLDSKKRNERSSGVFAFGSSTPRMLDPTDLTASYWGHRRATSIQNITCSTNSATSLTRRQSERDLDVGNKKRATSATGLERTGENTAPVIPAGCASGYTGRRRTDLIPTIPSRDPSFTSSRKSLNHSPASSRPSSSLSQQSTNSVTSSVSIRHRMVTAPRKPRPASIAVTGVTHDIRSDNKPPLPKTRKPISKSSSVTQKNKAKSPVDSVTKTLAVVQSVASEDETQQKPPDTAPFIQKPEENNVQAIANENLIEDSNKENVPENQKSDIELVPESKVVNKLVPVEEIENKIAEPKQTESLEVVKQDNTKETHEETDKGQKLEAVKEDSKQGKIEEDLTETEKTKKSTETEEKELETVVSANDTENRENNSSNIMTASMIKVRLNTEEEAKAALAEKRRLIREETERQAEMERLRLEAEAKAELERQQREEEQVRKLIELQRQTEQERLQEAIREAKKREEEERLKREEEQRLKQLKEEADRKAREEAERQKAELQERLKNEEKEREARRKRVEAIMLRTRGKNNANLPSQQSTDDKNENKSEQENKVVEESKVNGTKIVDQQENGTTKNSKDEEIVDNIIPSEIVKNANTVTIDTMNSSDSINSNNAWRDTQQYDSLM